MLGTMPDFSQAKHIDLTEACGEYQEGSLLASVFSNSFGDKIVYYRKYTVKGTRGARLAGFDTIGVVVYHENNHPSIDEMVQEAKRLVK